jgi:hypothetical protein
MAVTVNLVHWLQEAVVLVDKAVQTEQVEVAVQVLAQVGVAQLLDKE